MTSTEFLFWLAGVLNDTREGPIDRQAIRRPLFESLNDILPQGSMIPDEYLPAYTRGEQEGRDMREARRVERDPQPATNALRRARPEDVIQGIAVEPIRAGDVVAVAATTGIPTARDLMFPGVATEEDALTRPMERYQEEFMRAIDDFNSSVTVTTTTGTGTIGIDPGTIYSDGMALFSTVHPTGFGDAIAEPVRRRRGRTRAQRLREEGPARGPGNQQDISNVRRNH